MNTNRKYITSFVLAFTISLIGCCFTFIAGFSSAKGYLTRWVELEHPPEKIKAFIASGYAETITGKYIRYKSEHFQPIFCESNCWEIIDSNDIHPNEPLPISYCDWYPPVNNYETLLFVCDDWGGYGFYKAVWKTDTNGNVWLWQKPATTGMEFIVLPPIIFLAIFTLSGGIIALMTVFDGVGLLAKLNKQNTNDDPSGLPKDRKRVLFIEKLTTAFLFLFSITFLTLVVYNFFSKYCNSYNIIFFCFNPLSIFVGIYGVTKKHKKYIIIGLIDILIMICGWVSYWLCQFKYG